MRLQYILHICLLFLLPATTMAQQKATVQQSKTSMQKAVESLSTSLEANESDSDIAAGYEQLGSGLMAQGEYDKAESYFRNAKQLYSKTKEREKEANVTRMLARALEMQEKWDEATSYYEEASLLSVDNREMQINQNSANRIRNLSQPQNQAVYIQQNIDLLSDADKPEEKVTALRQMAEVNMEMAEPKAALSNLGQALTEAKDMPLEKAKVQREIANVYAADNQHEKAAVTLKEAYDIAISEGNTMEARNTLELLVEQYRKDKQTTKALEAYADFLSRLEPLIKGDSTLIDNRFFQVHEARIEQLEKEKELRDELIRKQNIFNLVLLVSVVLILIFLGFSIRSWYSIKQRNKRIALQSLRREMNPHFIFNSLNSVNQYIAENNELEANRFLSSYSRLMRNMMENSNKDFTTLATELEQLKEYLELEHSRFKDKFDYVIKIDESLDVERIYLPGMLIQPHLENAIWHGLRYKDEKGMLSLIIKAEKGYLYVYIEDNGIGLQRSQELKTTHQRKHHSRGLSNTNERINLLNSLYKCNISMIIKDKDGDDTGVIVELRFPLKEKV